MRFVRKHLTYANVVATLALLFAMTGGAYAATHYLINSTKQINPRVLRALEGASGSAGKSGANGSNGATGATGPSGPQGKEGATGPQGKEGPQGPEGQPGKEGPQGKEGPSSVVHWHVNTSSIGASKESPAPGVVKLAEVGVLTVWGHCYKNGSNTAAATYLSSASGSTYLHSFVTGEFDAVHSGRKALSQNTHYAVTEGIAEGTASPPEAALLGTNSSPFAAQAANLAVIGFPTDGVNLPGTGAACSFSGYLVVE
jgi:hypothetical protein